MPVGKILPYHALKTLTQLHAELGGKIDSNQKSGDKLRAQMMQVEAVMKMLDPEVNVRGISIKRRVIGNPWFKRGTMFRSAVDAMRRAGKPLTCREITDAVLEGKTPQPTRQQAINVQAAILAALQKRDGTTVVGEGTPTRWVLGGN
jgi:hypothetical protein